MKSTKPIRYVIYICIATILLYLPFHVPSYQLNMKQLQKQLDASINHEYVRASQPNELRQFYHIDSNDVKAVILYLPATSMRVNEVLVLEAASNETAEKLMTFVAERNNRQYTIFEGYGPKQCELLKQAILKQKGPYLIYIVGEDAAKLEAIIDAEVKS